MIKQLTAIFILTANLSYAQQRIPPSPNLFDRFISQPAIEWAQYADDTVRFAQPALNKLLAIRLAHKEIKASLPFNAESLEKISYRSKAAIDSVMLYPANMQYMYDSTGTRILTVQNPFTIDSSEFTLTQVNQVLYIEHGELRSYIPWVATKRPVSTSYGEFLGYTDYFSTCFNVKKDLIPGKKDKLVFLSKTNRSIKLNEVSNTDKLKVLYGKEMVETLWPYMLSGRIKVFSVDLNKPLKPAEIKASLIYTDKVPIPMYDSTGKVVDYKYVETELDPKAFKEIKLVQDWYYDHTANILFNKIRELVLYAHKWTSAGEDKAASPVLKIVFN